MARRCRWCCGCAALLTIAACHRGVPTVGPAPVAATPAVPSAPAAYVSDLTGIAYGDAFARATADGAPAMDDRASTANRAIDAAASKDGDERRRSCGQHGAPSHAQATAAFQPRIVASVRQFGFALSTSTYAQGGSWRERFVLCRQTHETVAAADARAVGRLDLVFNGAANDSERLLLRISGASPDDAHLEVRDARDQLLPLTAVPGGTSVSATLTTPGPYSIRAWIASSARSSGRDGVHDQQKRTYSVSAQSMRDALALGYGRSPADVLTVPLPVFVSTDAMTAALDTTLFTEQHRLYPCAKIDCGTTRLRDVYVEAPRVSTSGRSLVVDMHLAGSYHFGVVFGGRVSGTVRAMAMPVVEHDTLRFEDPRIDVASHNLLVKWRSGSFERMLLDRIGNVRIDLAPQLEAAVAKAQQRFSGAWTGVCSLVEPTDAHLGSVRVVTMVPQGIVANFGVELSRRSDGACRKQDAIR